MCAVLFDRHIESTGSAAIMLFGRKTDQAACYSSDEDSDIDRADNNDPVGLRDLPPPWTAEFWVQPQWQVGAVDAWLRLYQLSGPMEAKICQKIFQTVNGGCSCWSCII